MDKSIPTRQENVSKMRQTKKDKVKLMIGTQTGEFTFHEIYAWLTGVRAGMRWRTPIHQASESTVRRAINEMVESGELKAWYRIGHCFDECRYKVIGKED